MLKTLRITSLIALVLAVCSVLFIIILGLREDSDITAYLEKPGVVKQFQDQTTEEKKDIESPLVAQAHAFALRIDPPPPPKPPTPVKPKSEPTKTVQRTAPKPTPTPPTPKQAVSAKFTLLATVQCESDPSRSMVLLRQTGGKDEWFWQGERVGHLDIDEVRNGSAIFSQGGRNPQELFVPAKPQTKSLLKAETGTSKPSTPGSTSINILVDPETQEPVTADAAPSVSTESVNQQPQRIPDARDAIRSIRTERDRDASAAREEVTSRIRRIRTVPKAPTAEERKVSIEENISSIQAIMNREDTGVDEEQQEKENEAWMKLLTVLQSEKENLPAAEEEVTDEDGTSQGDDEGQAEADAQPGDPNEQED